MTVQVQDAATTAGNGQQSTTNPMHILIVGGGFAGLTAGIECRRRGWKVTLLEAVPERKQIGDSLYFGPNGTKIFQKWDGVAEKMEKVVQHTEKTLYYDYAGKHIYTHEYAHERDWGKRYFGHRGVLHEIVWNYAIELGVDIRLGYRVEEYFETDGLGGVVANGEKFTGDVVVAADGVRSQARKLVLGYEDMPDASGYAVYRTWYPAHDVAKDPKTAYLCAGDVQAAWLGTDVHFMIATNGGGKEISWVLTHKVCYSYLDCLA